VRARAILVAWVLAAQTLAPSLALASHIRSSCCCSTDSKKCHCPSCFKADAIEGGHCLINQCGGDHGQALVPSLDVATVAVALEGPAPRAVEPIDLRPQAPPNPSREVPTPPPLG
jgi:hypothetical protein